jgi:RHS repeat-associated protein
MPALGALTVVPQSQTINLDERAVIQATSTTLPQGWVYFASAGTLVVDTGCQFAFAICNLHFWPPVDTLPNGQQKLRPGTYTVTIRVMPGEEKISTVTVRDAAVTILPFNQTVIDWEVRRISAQITGMAFPQFTWSINGGGTIADQTRSGSLIYADYRADGLTPGTWTITATSDNSLVPISASALVAVPAVGPVTVTPKNLTLVKGQNQAFHAEIGNTTRRVANWVVSGGTFVTSPSGPVDVTVNAGPELGTGSITARWGHDASKFDTANFQVVVLPSVTVSPALVTVLPNSTTRFVAEVVALADPRVTWLTTMPGGTIDATGLFRAGATLGKYSVRATSVASLGVSGVATVIVSDTLPPPVSVSVNPTSAVVKPGANQLFVFYAEGQNNTPHANQTATWTVQPPPGGPPVAMATDGVFTAPDFAGKYVITARSNADPSKMAVAEALVPSLVEITPPTATVAPNGKVFFSAVARGVGNPAVTWSIQEPGPGSGDISSTGKYTAGVPGTYHIIAASVANPAVRGTATVRVDPAADFQIKITPASVILDLRQTQRFDALVVGIEDQAVSWSATAGEIDPNGMFTAPNRYGTVEVRATSRVDAAVYGTATVVVTSPGGQIFEYDANGNLTFDGVRRYFWDAEDRLVRVEQSAGEEGRGARVYAFVYDAFGRLRRLRETIDGAVTNNQTFLWVNEMLAEERTASGFGVVRRFFPEGMQENGLNYYFFRDHLGSIRDVTDGGANVRARYDYDAWGRRTFVPAADNGGGRDEEPVPRDKASPLGFNGFYHHDFLGLDLAWFRAYSADLGRWISSDPIGLRGGTNTYAFAANDPVNLVDPYGLVDCPPGWHPRPEPECKSIMCLDPPEPETPEDTPEIPPYDPFDAPPIIPREPDPCMPGPCIRGPLTPFEEAMRDLMRGHGDGHSGPPHHEPHRPERDPRMRSASARELWEQQYEQWRREAERREMLRRAIARGRRMGRR